MATSNGKETSQSSEKKVQTSLLFKLEKISLNQEAIKDQYSGPSNQAQMADFQMYGWLLLTHFQQCQDLAHAFNSFLSSHT